MAVVDVRTRNNVQIAGCDTGPTIVLAHGFGCDQNLWHRVTAQLAPTFNVVLFDHVGSGAADPSAWDERRYSTLDGYTQGE